MSLGQPGPDLYNPIRVLRAVAIVSFSPEPTATERLKPPSPLAPG
jgi:hypothetical protein